jgi:DNA-binding HxlR family transcriptional regulator
MSSSVLRDRLAELTSTGLVETADDGRYALAAHGRALLTALEPLSHWADGWARASPTAR